MPAERFGVSWECVRKIYQQERKSDSAVTEAVQQRMLALVEAQKDLTIAELRDLNPIEKAWSKLKHLLRTPKARTAHALLEALRNALPQLAPENAKAWFRTCLGWVQL